jgi:hypothetical protein
MVTIGRGALVGVVSEPRLVEAEKGFLKFFAESRNAYASS